jgi:hypothetical protein
MVAAWIRAETGVGPSMASGSQTNSGIWADFPVAPRKRSSVMAVTTSPPAGSCAGAEANTWSYWRVPRVVQSSITPRAKPKSPTRLTMKAFFPASAADCFSNQKPMSRYEHRPTASQKTYSRR